MEVRIARLWLGAAVLTTLLAYSSPDPARAHDRRKRFIWLTTDGRLALPPGSSLTITPSLALPFVRYTPVGFLANMSISLPFTIVFDALGLTDNQNPYGVLPPLFARSMGRMSGRLLADYVAQLMDHRRGRRAAPDKPPLADEAFHGGERAILYTIVEELLENFGMDGHACLLRAICEVHGMPDQRYGLVGEILKLFFSASKSPYAHLLDEYVEAETSGQQDGECWRFYKDCPKSLFHQSHRNKYTGEDHLEEEEGEFVDYSRPPETPSWSSNPQPAKKIPTYDTGGGGGKPDYGRKKTAPKKVVTSQDMRFM